MIKLNYHTTNFFKLQEMKKTLLYAGLLLAGSMGLTACSSSDDVTPSGEVKPGESQYVTVNVRNVTAAPMQRDVEGYENGTEDESKLGTVRFYFFYANGSAFGMTNSSAVGAAGTSAGNYLDYNFAEGDQNEVLGGDNETVERKSKAVLVLNGVDGGSPAYVIAIANPAKANLPGSMISRDQLVSTALTTNTYADPDNKNFVMTNSVYTQNGAAVCATSTTGKVYTSRDMANENPVEIYVERVAAKVTAAISNSADWTTTPADVEGGKTAIKVQDITTINPTNGEPTTTSIYAVVLGWGLADEMEDATVEKNITGFSDNWNLSVMGATAYNAATGEAGTTAKENWSTDNYHRSFWEVIPTYNKKSQSFDQYVAANRTLTATKSVAYTMPNTSAEGVSIFNANRNQNPTDRTKILVAARLYYQTTTGTEDERTTTWHKAEIARDLTTATNYLGKENLTNAILARFTNIEKGTTTDADTTWSKLTSSDVEYKAVAGKPYEKMLGLVNTKAEGVTYRLVSATTAGESSTLTADQVESRLNVAHAMIYTDGDTYYYTTIQHLAAAEKPATCDQTVWDNVVRPMGWFGIVRNHLYDITINKLEGLGTAVYTPGEDIEPVTPTNTLSYMAARINVLQWRVVSQTVDLNGNPNESPRTGSGD